MKDKLSDEVFIEKHTPYSGLFIEYKKKLEDIQSEFQHIEVFETHNFGNLLTLDSLVMVTEFDEFYYHEMLTHPILFGHPNPENVLIIGGGDGGTVREVAKHSRCKRIVLCEIDEKVINVSRKYFPDCTRSLDDPRVKIVCRDGFEYLKETKNEWDVILMDTSEPIGPGEKLFTSNFYELVYHSLNNTGICCAQSENPDRNMKIFINLFNIISGIFPDVSAYMCPIYTYPGSFWTFTIGSKKYHPKDNFQEAHYNKQNLKLKYYNSDIHKACFALPQFVKEAIKGIK